MLFTWDSGFGNDQLGVTRRRAGRQTAPSATPQQHPLHAAEGEPPGRHEMAGTTRERSRSAHMQNFLDCVREPAKPTNCPFDVGFRVSIACRMAVESYRQSARVRWDAAEGRDRLRPRPWISSTRRNRLQLRKAVRRVRRGGDRARTSWSGTRRRLSRSKSVSKLGELGYLGSIFPKSWAAPGSATSSTRSSSKSCRASMARSGSSWRRTLRSARTTFSRRAPTSSGSSICRSWPPASGSAAGR